MTEKLSDKIIAEIRRGPHRRGLAIADATGASRSYVSVVARHNGLNYGPDRRSGAPIAAALSEENRWWVLRQCEAHGFEIADFVDACVTDARLDDEELGAA